MVHTRIAVALACALSLAAVGCSSSSSSAEGGIGVTEQDFTITVSPSSVAAGSVTFNITNNGPSAHEDSLDVIDEAEDIPPGTTPTLTVDLEAGSYILMCNIVGHYQQGMHTGFTVT